jgi:hypothetical protein
MIGLVRGSQRRVSITPGIALLPPNLAPVPKRRFACCADALYASYENLTFPQRSGAGMAFAKRRCGH